MLAAAVDANLPICQASVRQGNATFHANQRHNGPLKQALAMALFPPLLAHFSLASVDVWSLRVCLAYGARNAALAHESANETHSVDNSNRSTAP